MPDEVILDVTTIEENVTVETTAGDVVGIQVVAPTGPAGATGPAGPNSVTSATTSDGTGQIMLDTLAVGICNILDEVVFDTLTYTFAEGSAQALKDALDISFADISDAQTGTANLTLNNVSTVSFTAGNSSTTSGEITIFTNGPVFQWRSDTVEYGERGFTFLTTDITSEVNYTLPNSSGTIALTANASGEPDKLTAGTISGATTFNTTSYTYGTGAAAAHRTALGLTTLATTTPAANVATFLETPSSANLAAAVTDETGSGSLVFGTSPTLTTPTIAQINGNTTASGTLTLQSTTNDTKGKILFGTSAYDETTNALGIGNTSPSYKLEIGNASAAFDALNSSTGLGVLSSSTRNSFFIESTAASSSSAGAFIGAYSNDGSAMASGDRLGGFFFGGYDGSVMRNAAIIHAFSEEAWSGGANGTGVTIGTTAAGTTSRSDKFFFRSSGSLLIGTPTENTKSILTLESTTRGFLPPRMTTTQRNAITSVPAGLMVYNTTTNKLNFYNGSAWEAVTSL
jgi:hypothetical protein